MQYTFAVTFGTLSRNKVSIEAKQYQNINSSKQAKFYYDILCVVKIEKKYLKISFTHGTSIILKYHALNVLF